MLPIPGRRYPERGPLSFMFFRGVKPSGVKHFHRGVDIAAPLGEPVLAVESGTITHAIRKATSGFRGYGKTVVLLGNSGTYYLFGHLDRVDVDKGDRVRVGQQVGTVGITAYRRGEPRSLLRSRAPHLHFEASDTKYPKGSEAKRIDPLKALASTPPVPARSARAGFAGGALLVVVLALAYMRAR